MSYMKPYTQPYNNCAVPGRLMKQMNHLWTGMWRKMLPGVVQQTLPPWLEEWQIPCSYYVSFAVVSVLPHESHVSLDAALSWTDSRSALRRSRRAHRRVPEFSQAVKDLDMLPQKATIIFTVWQPLRWTYIYDFSHEGIIYQLEDALHGSETRRQSPIGAYTNLALNIDLAIREALESIQV